MPLKKGKSRKTVSENVSKEMHKYERSGRVGRGSNRPASKKKAQKQAVAIALSEARRSGAKVPKKGKGKSTKGLTGKSPSRSKSSRSSARKSTGRSSTRKSTSRSRSSGGSSRKKSSGGSSRKSASRKTSSRSRTGARKSTSRSRKGGSRKGGSRKGGSRSRSRSR